MRPVITFRPRTIILAVLTVLAFTPGAFGFGSAHAAAAKPASAALLAKARVYAHARFAYAENAVQAPWAFPVKCSGTSKLIVCTGDTHESVNGYRYFTITLHVVAGRILPADAVPVLK